mmetsp:Transcript_131786/g.328650  ORF Transcript_131786/g.328650 Transcript_131786/m.328650 type:complete len:120 (+) Transcript_131786:1403-1762(+)
MSSGGAYGKARSIVNPPWPESVWASVGFKLRRPQDSLLRKVSLNLLLLCIKTAISSAERMIATALASQATTRVCPELPCMVREADRTVRCRAAPWQKLVCLGRMHLKLYWEGLLEASFC